MDVLLLQHAYRDGRLEEVVLRHLGSEDGETVIAKNIRFCLYLLLLAHSVLVIARLSEFLSNMRIR